MKIMLVLSTLQNNHNYTMLIFYIEPSSDVQYKKNTFKLRKTLEGQEVIHNASET